ncbi:MAG: zinc-dependent metalloprotease [Acidobacteriota bacterium]|nr:zinc-dependent metalloprotease [Acidobacteriota bacterium]
MTALAVLGTCLAIAGPPARAATSRLDSPRLAEIARGVPTGGVLRIEGITVPGGGTTALELERFRVFSPAARILVHAPEGLEARQAPRTAYFRGRLERDPESLALVALPGVLSLPSSGPRGWIATQGRWLRIVPGDQGSPPEILETDLAASEPPADGFCAAGSLDDLPPGSLPPPLPTTSPPAERTAGEVQYAVDLAIDTDWELFQRFGSAPAATDYLADLVAAASAIYARDVSTQLQLSLLILWETPADPWTVESDLLEALYELGDWWHANHAGTERTLAHLASGKTGLAGGIAYGGVLCSPDIFVNGHWAGGYAVTGAVGSNTQFRDLFVFSHELGHNFDSRHTHCYNDVPLPGDPEIDQCRSGETTGGGHVCYAGPETVPPDGGSIMSYCHLQPGGYGNINLWLGREGFYGIRSERVPEKMLQHVEEVAACLPPPTDLFADGFESGDTSAWSSTVP